ncbi:MAG: hypothetical protein BM485_11235 [Desulfobulbaceae bacterium DB1]|nr:MAG: hypothetical protein BM485_11235 [Desulfobulbaceae bacterium DB1]
MPPIPTKNLFSSPPDVMGSVKTSYDKKSNSLLIILCWYIFLLTERPWESISYLHDLRIQFIYAIFMILVAAFSGRLIIVKANTNKWVLGLLGLHFILAPFAFSPASAIDTGIEYAKIVLLYILLVSSVETKEDLKLILKAFVLSMLFYSLHSLWEFHNGRHEWRMGIVRMIGVGDAYSNPNGFAASLTLAMPFAYLLARFEQTKYLRRLYYGYLVLAPICIVLTGSRTGFVAMLLCFMLQVFRFKGLKKFFILVFLVVFIIVGWQLMPEDKQRRIETLWNEDAGPANAKESAEGRIEGFLASLEMFKQHPFTGVGAGKENFIGYRTSFIDGVALQSHNLYGEVISQLGIGGAFFLLGLIWSTVRGCLVANRNLAEKGESGSFFQALGFTIIATLILLLLFGVGGHNFYRPLWLMLAAWSSNLLKISTVPQRLTIR